MMSGSPPTEKLHWADKIAENIIRRQPEGCPRVTCASGVSPSGPVHVGNLRDILTLGFVAHALRERHVTVRLIHSWDDFDRFRKVPQNIPESFKEFLGKPLSKVPDPFGQYPSYAARYETEFESSLLDLGITMECIRQTERYESGDYRAAICEAVKKRDLIYDILSRFKTQDASHEDREAFFPLTIYCERCGRDTTAIRHRDVSETVFPYTCQCQYKGDIEIESARNIKLPWKVDWAMRWRHEAVVFEPGGKDHATSGGSFEVSREIAEKVFQHRPPIFQPYEFIGIKGRTGKMSGSSGILLTPQDLLAIYSPELILWVFAKTDPNRAFDIVTDEGIYRLYDQFDQAWQTLPRRRDVTLSMIPGRSCDITPFRHLAGFAGIVDDDRSALSELLTRMGIPCKAERFEERLQKALYWLHHYAPEDRVTLLKERQEAYFQGLSSLEQEAIQTLYNALCKKEDLNLEEITQLVYNIPKQGFAEAEWAAAQRRFFQILYNLLFGKDKGPRLPTFFSIVTKARYLNLLRFGGEGCGSGARIFECERGI